MNVHIFGGVFRKMNILGGYEDFWGGHNKIGLYFRVFSYGQGQLEDLMVLKRSPDLLNNVKIGQDQLRLTCIIKNIFCFMGVAAILVK